MKEVRLDFKSNIPLLKQGAVKTQGHLNTERSGEFKIGKLATLYLNDCLDVMDYLISEGVVVDAIITDPPYGTTRCKWDSVIPLDEMWSRLQQLVKPNGAVVLFGSEPFSSALRMSNAKHYKYDWIWEKSNATGHLNANKMPMRAHELISVFYCKQCVYNPQKTKGHPKKVSTAEQRKNCVKTEVYNSHGLVSYNSTERYPRSVLKFPSDKQKTNLHPTQKPLALMEYLIKTYTLEGDVVLDFTMGSGSTGAACIKLNRVFIGIEKNTEYFKKACNRLEEINHGNKENLDTRRNSRSF